MSQYFQRIDEAYIQKQYPDRSVLTVMGNRNKKGNLLVAIFFGIFAAACLMSVAFIVKIQIASGDADQFKIVVIFTVILLVIALACLIPIVLEYKRSHLKTDDLVKLSAKNSGLTQNELREFEHQALQSDSYVIKLVKGPGAAKTSNTDGILTRDYIWLNGSDLTVMRLKSLRSASLATASFYTTVGKKQKKVEYRTINLMTQEGVQTSAETSVEAGKELQAILLERCPDLDLMNGQILE